MNKTELKEKYTDAPACGVWSDGLVGIELLDMLYDIEDSATVRGYNGDLHRVKVYYTDTSAYIRLYGRRYYFRDCMRV
jgi:hypothetical protein